MFLGESVEKVKNTPPTLCSVRLYGSFFTGHGITSLDSFLVPKRVKFFFLGGGLCFSSTRDDFSPGTSSVCFSIDKYVSEEKVFLFKGLWERSLAFPLGMPLLMKDKMQVCISRGLPPGGVGRARLILQFSSSNYFR